MVARSKGLMLLPQKSYLQSLYESFSHSEGSDHQIVTLLLGNNPVTGIRFVGTTYHYTLFVILDKDVGLLLVNIV